MNRIIDYIKRYGIADCLRKIQFRVCRALGYTYIKYYAYYKELSDASSADALQPYRRLTMEDFRTQADYAPEWFTPRKLKQIEGFISQPGYAYFGLFDGERLMCYAALSTEFDCFINAPLAKGEAYLFDDYTRPDYRGRGLHRAVTAIREQAAREQGLSRTFAYVLSTNRASARGFIGCGYLAKKQLTYKRIGKKGRFTRKITEL